MQSALERCLKADDLRSNLENTHIAELRKLANALGIKGVDEIEQAELIEMVIDRAYKDSVTQSPPFQLFPVKGLVRWARPPYLRSLQELVVGPIKTAVVSSNKMYVCNNIF